MALGVGITEQRAKPLRTMAQIFTSKGRGERREKPIGFEAEKPNRVSGVVRARSLGLCRVSPPNASGQTPAAPVSQDTVSAARADCEDSQKSTPMIDHIVRVREDDFTPDQYDYETGEFYESPPASRSERRRGDRWAA